MTAVMAIRLAGNAVLPWRSVDALHAINTIPVWNRQKSTLASTAHITTVGIVWARKSSNQKTNGGWPWKTPDDPIIHQTEDCGWPYWMQGEEDEWEDDY